jgi:hypothetical protein
MADERVLILEIPAQQAPAALASGDPAHATSDYFEWKTLRRWGKLPAWEDVLPGYLLREARERAGFTQKETAARLGVQPAGGGPRRKSRSAIRRFLSSGLGGRLGLPALDFLKGDAPG